MRSPHGTHTVVHLLPVPGLLSVLLVVWRRWMFVKVMHLRFVVVLWFFEHMGCVLDSHLVVVSIKCCTLQNLNDSLNVLYPLFNK